MPVVRLLEQYFARLGISPRVNEQEDTTYEHYEVVISRRDDIRRLLETVRTYILVRKQAVDILLNDILPALDAGAHSEQQSFIELMGDIDAFRNAAGRANRSKYDQEYFINEWEVDPE